MNNDYIFPRENILILLGLICGAESSLSVQEMCHQLALAVLDSCVLEEPSFPPQMIMRLEYRVQLGLTVQLEVLQEYLVPRAHLGIVVTHYNTKQLKHFTILYIKSN